MMRDEERVQAVATGSEIEVNPPGKILKAGPVAVAAYRQKVREAGEVAQQQQREREDAEAVATRRGIRAAKASAKARGEEVEEDRDGSVVIGRDGLLWLSRKGKLHPAHLRAGLKFREDFELCGSSMVSSLGMAGFGGTGFGPKLGATDAHLEARSSVEAALAALGTPLLHPYVILVAGLGEMLSGPRFGGSRQKAEAHLHPCIIALDALARHYGMIR